MVDVGLFKYLSDKLDLDWFNLKERDKIYKLTFSYFLGIINYSFLFQESKEFGIQNDCSCCIRGLKEDDVRYIIFNLRRYAKYKIKNFIHLEDKVCIKKLSRTLDYTQIPLIKKYPAQNKILEDTTPFMYNLIAKNYSYDNAIDKDDILSEFRWKSVQTYRTYIFGYGKYLNKLSLYSCIYQSVRNRNIDLIRTQNTLNRRVHLNTIALNEALL